MDYRKISLRRWIAWQIPALLIFGAAPAAAQQSSWNTNASGEYQVPANWTGGVPTGFDAAMFARGAGASYSVSLPGGPTTLVSQIIVEANDVTLTSSDPLAKFRAFGSDREEERGLYVGRQQTGAIFTMDMNDFQVRTATVGHEANSHGTINIGRAEAVMWIADFSDDQIPANFILGRYGAGVLDVTGGWAFMIGDHSDAHFGRYAGGSGVANIIGPTANLSVGGGHVIGFAGYGELNVAGGGLVQSFSNSVLGAVEGGVGEARVTGAGTQWRNFSRLVVGDEGEGRLRIEQGAKTTSNNAWIGYDVTGRGSVEIDGAGSFWDVLYTLEVGVFGVGELTVRNQARVEASRIEIAEFGAVRGNSTLDGFVLNGGIIAPDAVNGQLAITGNYQQTDVGQLLVELGSVDNYSHLDVAGAATLAGTLKVQLSGGFAPAAGQSFDVLDYASVSGQFTTIDLPSLPNELQWDASNLYTTGVLGISPVFTADFDDDGDVDGEDLIEWQAAFGPTSADANGVDFLAWQRQRGSKRAVSSSTTASAAVAKASAVPEPAALGLLSPLALMWMGMRRRA